MNSNLNRHEIFKGRVLVIDADREMRLCIEMVLTPQGYQVVSSATWREALQLLQKDHFDLVLSDLQAGGGRGDETAKALFAGGECREIIICIPQGKIREGRLALCSGAAGYLLQPYDTDELLTLVDRAIFRTEESASLSTLFQENNDLRANLQTFDSCMKFLLIDDLDRLGDLVIDTLMESCAAESGILWLTGPGHADLALHSLRGLSQVGSLSSEVLSVAPEIISQGESPPRFSEDGMTLYVPLRSLGRLIGLVRLEAAAGRGLFGEGDCRIAGQISIFAAGALTSLLRRQEVEHNLLRAPGSQAYNMAFFRDHLEKGLYSAKRYDRKLVLIKVVIDNYAELSARFLDRMVRDALEKIIATIMTVLRDADLICQVIPGQYYVLLPETDSWGGLMAQRRMRKALSGQLLLSDLKKNIPIRVQMRSVTAPQDGTTLPELDQLMERRLAMLRSSLLLRGQLEGMSFWKIVDALLSSDGAKLLQRQGESKAVFLPFHRDQLEPYCVSVCRELLGAVPVSGVILWGGEDLSVAREALGAILGSHESRTAIYLLGGGADQDSAELPSGVMIPLQDEFFAENTFLLSIGEDFAYALLARRTESGWHAFHTNDFYFVENMLAKLQEHYQLQAQI